MGTADPPPADASRRTHLANERTYLAWWRTAIAALAMAIGVGRLLPEVLDTGTTWPYVVLGVAWALVGVGLSLYALYRQREVDRALRRGGYAEPARWVLAGVSLAGATLGVLTLVVILVAPA
ncbi:MAG: DUF202 domain-containing protein [Thermoleophilia bacterium]|jgi:putative membrane protein|nr:DUF202 domain-containing protein [Thermoleophilia bacterium]